MISYDLTSWDFLLIAVKVVCAFITSFLSIFLWRKTRRAGEIFLVMGVLSMFVKAVYDVLLVFGFFSQTTSYLKNFPVFVFVFSLLPYLLFMLSLIFFIKER